MRLLGVPRATVIALGLCSSAASADTILFEADKTVVIVRGYDESGSSVLEFIGELDAFYEYLALGTDGQPLAVTNAVGGSASIYFIDLAIGDVADVECRRT